MERSADTGNLLHNILEDHDFSEGKTLHIEQTNEHLAYYTSGQRSCDIDALNKWLNEVIATPLPIIGDQSNTALCSLNALKEGHILKEPEFYFPLTSVNTHNLNALMQTHRSEVSGAKALPFSIKYADLQGMMHGFIDLLFEHQGKFYVADYKSNHIGNTSEDYRSKAMQHAIQSHLYDLQYLIYSWALDRFLHHRLGEQYEREQHFGGVYYLFMRGMSPDFAMGTGVYHTPISAATWQQLDRIFSDKGSAA
jgi:exodeoxyribonuclease V beta subunit